MTKYYSQYLATCILNLAELTALKDDLKKLNFNTDAIAEVSTAIGSMEVAIYYAEIDLAKTEIKKILNGDK